MQAVKNRYKTEMYRQTALLHCLEAHIQALDRVCERAYRDKVNTTESIAAQSIEGDTAR